MDKKVSRCSKSTIVMRRKPAVFHHIYNVRFRQSAPQFVYGRLESLGIANIKQGLLLRAKKFLKFLISQQGGLLDVTNRLHSE
jgi:hypothetical protein